MQLVGDKDGIIHGPEWHAQQMDKLTSFVTKLADESGDDVREWLKLNRPAEYKPRDLLSVYPITENVQIEETKDD